LSPFHGAAVRRVRKIALELVGFAARLVTATEPSQRLDTDHVALLAQYPVRKLASMATHQSQGQRWIAAERAPRSLE
jgi:hypothetical protein